MWYKTILSFLLCFQLLLSVNVDCHVQKIRDVNYHFCVSCSTSQKKTNCRDTSKFPNLKGLCVPTRRHRAKKDVKSSEGKRAKQSAHLLAGEHQGRQQDQTAGSQHTSFWSLPMDRPCYILFLCLKTNHDNIYRFQDPV